MISHGGLDRLTQARIRTSAMVEIVAVLRPTGRALVGPQVIEADDAHLHAVQSTA